MYQIFLFSIFLLLPKLKNKKGHMVSFFSNCDNKNQNKEIWYIIFCFRFLVIVWLMQQKKLDSKYYTSYLKVS